MSCQESRHGRRNLNINPLNVIENSHFLEHFLYRVADLELPVLGWPIGKQNKFSGQNQNPRKTWTCIVWWLFLFNTWFLGFWFCSGRCFCLGYQFCTGLVRSLFLGFSIEQVANELSLHVLVWILQCFGSKIATKSKRRVPWSLW